MTAFKSYTGAEGTSHGPGGGDPIAGLYRLTAAKEGLFVEWLSGNSLRVGAGAAHVPALGRVAELTADLTLTGMTFAANSWYYVYLYEDGAGNAAVEYVTTTPSAPYRGRARTKGGDASRRYLGALRSNGNATPGMFRWQKVGAYHKWLEDVRVDPFRVLNGGAATAETNVSCAAVVPPTSRAMKGHVVNAAAGSGGVVAFGHSEDNTALTSGGGITRIGANGTVPLSEEQDMALDSQQRFSYVAGSGGASVDVYVRGYHEEV